MYCISEYQRLCKKLPVEKATKNVFNAVMFDECVLELWPEMATRGRLINIISAFLHILSVALH